MKFKNKRQAGILCHVTSLPSPNGVGDFGPIAYRFVDFLAKSGQSSWQILPIGNTDDSGCAYATDSAFGGAPFLISLEKLTREKLISKGEIRHLKFTQSRVNFKKVKNFKIKYLRLAFKKFKPNDEYFNFLSTEQFWLEDYALFSALKDEFGYNWKKWKVDLHPFKIEKLDPKIRENIEFHKFVQFVFFRQLSELKAYANGKGISLIGDLPIFVSYFSMDVWRNPSRFHLSKSNRLEFETGACPDAFSSEGQKWGTPIYDWKVHKNENYLWWQERMRFLKRYFDVIRIDHFRGFQATWISPTAERTAKNGEWFPGPGAELFNAILKDTPEVIAEDLGVITEDVEKLRDQFSFPGMRILQFLSADQDNPHRPQNYTENSVVYTATHDCENIAGWLKGASPQQKLEIAHLEKTEKCGSKNPVDRIIEIALKSKSNRAIIQIQDLLHLGNGARFNVPGTTTNRNWTWRLKPGELEKINWNWLKKLTIETQRIRK